jgi:saccharopine dehydrogenase (NAD+, L-glutamate forming)
MHLLVIGAGRSTAYLTKYLFEKSNAEGFTLTVCDKDISQAEMLVKNHPRGKAEALDIFDPEARSSIIALHDIVISMVPASMHVMVARDCIALRKHMVTASYVSDEMRSFDQEAKEAGVVIMNEIGVDPGIDHMSAMKVLDDLRAKGAKLLQFESFTGGLLAPESELKNPWRYKFTWNPRNVVVAGQGGAVKFIQEGTYKYIPYHNLFRRTEYMDIEGYGRFEGYANRDSLKYRSVYGLQDIPTIYRGTLRRPGFCKAWDVFVKLGATDDSYVVENSAEMTHRQFINLFLAYNPTDSVELKLMHYLKIDQDSEIMEKLHWLGLFEDTKVGLADATPAQILEHILKKKWALDPSDKDMIVMYHKFGYSLNGKNEQIESSMVCVGEDATYTAMAKTVGLPVAIAATMIAKGVISTPGVHLPISREVYEPVLAELVDYGISFTDKKGEYLGY